MDPVSQARATAIPSNNPILSHSWICCYDVLFQVAICLPFALVMPWIIALDNKDLDANIVMQAKATSNRCPFLNVKPSHRRNLKVGHSAFPD